MSNKTNAPERDDVLTTLRYIPAHDFEIKQVKRGVERYAALTVGSWWAPKALKDGSAQPAYQVLELIPSLPMNKVMVSRAGAVLSVNALVNSWDPVTPRPNVSICVERKKPRKPAPGGLKDRVTELEQRVTKLDDQLRQLVHSLGGRP